MAEFRESELLPEGHTAGLGLEGSGALLVIFTVLLVLSTP